MGLSLLVSLNIPSRGKVHPALYICHGITAVPLDPPDKDHSLLAQRFCRAGFITLIFGSGGTGKSEGDWGILDWNRDLRAALDFPYSLEGADKALICLLGFGGQAVVCAYTADHDPRVSLVATHACPADFRPLRQTEMPLETIQRFHYTRAITDEDFPLSIEEWQRGFETVCLIKRIDRISPRLLLLVHGNAD